MLNMHADFELGEDGDVFAADPPQRTFPPRSNGGRPVGYSPKKAREEQRRQEADDADEDDDVDDADLSTAVRTARAKARKETALADMRELDYAIKSGQYLPRDAFRQAAATLLATLSQSLRSLPDELERKHGLAPDVLVRIETTIDAALNDAADKLSLFTES